MKKHIALALVWILALGLTANASTEATADEDGGFLHAAVWEDKPEALEALLKAGGNPEATDEDGLTPLMVASQTGSVGCASVLLKHQADLGRGNSQDRQKTPLIYAVLGGHPAMVEFLLSRGADLEQVDEDKVTPVSWAAYGAELPLLRLLVERGARLDVVDGFGDDLLAAARNGRRSDNLEYLIGVGAGNRTPR